MHYYFRVAEANRMFQGEDEKRNTKGRINQQQKPGKNKKTQKMIACGNMIKQNVLLTFGQERNVCIM